MELTIATGTFGTSDWAKLARTRAFPSVVAEKAPWVHKHRETLAEARNAALGQVKTEWVCFLDADDELEPGYVEAMCQGTADVRGPLVRYMNPDGSERNLWQPRVWNHHHDCGADCITSGEGNWLVVGACVRTELVREVGGWKDWPVYEDFDLWMRVLLTGASVELVPDAVYRAWVRNSSRNRAPAMATKDATHRAIVAANLPDAVVAA